MKEHKHKLTLSLSCSEKFFRSLLLQRSNLRGATYEEAAYLSVGLISFVGISGTQLGGNSCPASIRKP
ncbi:MULTISPECIES: hypothetical protein [Nostocaceae]|uniref:Uncharacterized protein n=1 Tax=Anabaena cylindrica FACHB-318 TaxID=2692880 RepID=A0ABR7ZDL4_ANACY|nr:MULTISPECIES: hypothetical protein [Nostocaceae]MBD2170609.1 hypothetical protein [Anabaena cylindrica FACHB-318]MBD2262396.1 hypothetical protein [Anabaena sp. FACHB-709]MBD2271943.1 hypothetical protein [Nostoc sp. PCC 7120 = FACHB-418]MBD2282732.1 hypothetical protein [Anabaena cylindrica FACHB-170]MBD2347992.1 hypothetical protein [Trichormus variabilis FACHB-171]